MASSKIEFKIGPAEITKDAGVMGFDVDSKDFNDYIHSGVYKCGGTNQGFTHAPHNSDNGYLMVVGNHNPVQIWFGAYVGLIRARHRVSNEWTSWVDVVNWGGVNISLLSADSPGVQHDEYDKEASTRGSGHINRRYRNNYDPISKAVWNRISDLVWKRSLCSLYKNSDDYEHKSISEWWRRTCSDSERRLQLHPVKSSMVQHSLLHRNHVISTISRKEVAA